MRGLLVSLVAIGMVGWVAGCSTEPTTNAKREVLQDDAQNTLKSLEATDSGLANVVNNGYAYIVFPDVSKGGVGIGGAFGRGIVYEQGRPIGYAAIEQASAGLMIGGQTYSELIVFKDQEAFRKFESSRLSFGAEASAVALKAGAAASTQFKNGVAVFVHNQGGLMADASLNGQNIKFTRASESEMNSNSNSQDRM
jgi:lipid-binding SYLF domain-containing protein